MVVKREAPAEDLHMLNTYKAVLKGSRLEWRGSSPPEVSTEKEIAVEVTVLRDERLSASRASDAGKRMASALEKLADSGAVAGIEDPVAWQREMRQDRRLPGRN